MSAVRPDPSVAAPKPSPRGALPVFGGAYFALAVLFGMNLLNYIDRYSFFAVGTKIQKVMEIDDFWFGLVAASFMIVYTIVSPLMGWLGDRYNRKVLLASGVGLWSLATIGTAFSKDYTHLFFWRALLGIGEASYGVIAPALIADLFPLKQRGRAMGLYYLALPLGGALGYAIGSLVGENIGWQESFFVVGVPGLLVAAAGLMILDPGRGASEQAAHPVAADEPSHETAAEAPRAPASVPKQDRPGMKEYLELFKTPTFVYNTAGMAAVTFATGAYAAWGSTFYQTVRGMTMSEAGLSIGVLTATAGLVGIALGTFLADYLLKFTKRAYLLLAAVVVAVAIPLGLFGILDPEKVSSLTFLFGAMVMLAMVLGPCNTVIANVVPAKKRAAGYALYIFLIHIFGDISSPILVGAISNLFGNPTVVASPVGRFFSMLGANPVDKTNLTVAMLAVVPILALGCVFFVLGSRHLPEDVEKAKALGGDAPAGAVHMH